MKKLLVLWILAGPLLAIAQPPNIILILADDQGWNGLSCRMDPDVPGSGSDFYQTPNLERLAKEGMRFSRGYAPAPVCSPTRHSIQFGISPAKLRITHNSAVHKQFCDPSLALANLIKRADARYLTAHFGKWHVSVEPETCGYDESDGCTTNKEGNNSRNPKDPKRTYEVTERAIGFLEKTVGAMRPFFMQVSYYADHLKFMSSPAMQQKYEALPSGIRHTDPMFAGMNEDLDQGVGRILKAIERLGISDNTYIFYMADNGFDESNRKLDGIAKRKAWPLSYSKGFVFEGGIRVPFIVRGPGIAPGSISKVPVVGYDLMPTFLELINPNFKLPNVVEGGSLLPLLKNGGRGKVERPNDFLIFHYPTGVWPAQTSMIQGDYKIVKTWAFDRVELFNLSMDISETKNLAAALPEKAAQMHREMMRYLKRIDAVLPPAEELEVDRNGVLMKKAGAKKARKKKSAQKKPGKKKG